MGDNSFLLFLTKGDTSVDIQPLTWSYKYVHRAYEHHLLWKWPVSLSSEEVKRKQIWWMKQKSYSCDFLYRSVGYNCPDSLLSPVLTLSITYRRQLCPSNVYHMNLSNTRGLHDLNVVNRVACVNVSMNVCVWFFGRSCFLTVFFLDQDKSFARYLTFIQWRINFDGTSWRCIENDATLISCHVPFELESLSTTIFR